MAPTEIFRNLVTYYVTSWKTGVETEVIPRNVTISDTSGQHQVHVKEW